MAGSFAALMTAGKLTAGRVVNGEEDARRCWATNWDGFWSGSKRSLPVIFCFTSVDAAEFPVILRLISCAAATGLGSTETSSGVAGVAGEGKGAVAGKVERLFHLACADSVGVSKRLGMDIVEWLASDVSRPP